MALNKGRAVLNVRQCRGTIYLAPVVNSIWKYRVTGQGEKVENVTVWQPVYWLYSALLPLTVYAFEAVKVSLYEATRAPNVSLLEQLTLLLLFFGVWSFLPRMIWKLVERIQAMSLQYKAGWIAGAGLVGSATHLLILALILRIMHSPPGWGIGHLLHSFGEVWLGYGVFWLLIYGVFAAIILFRFSKGKPGPTPVSRFEVKKNNHTHFVAKDQIGYVQAAGNYVELHTAEGTFLLRQSLKQMADALGGEFSASHRSILVNLEHVLSIEPNASGSGYIIHLKNGITAPLSRRRLSIFKSYL